MLLQSPKLWLISWNLHSDVAARSTIQSNYEVIKIMGKTLAPFATSNFIPVFGFGDVKTSDWSVFKLKPEGECVDLDDVLRVYKTPSPRPSPSPGPRTSRPSSTRRLPSAIINYLHNIETFRTDIYKLQGIERGTERCSASETV
ncbi:hypothetical protein L596_002216 [Steinernema carpocapsae]|uniref:Copine C-terminal domain-containing protein n=1 Tax=Steinernema carpocapsae TaxID=34508 RepID=A0A4U8UR90_STECR|nr:hypothetical protein L596_002216 [Steinernema carpocapsae]